MGDGRKAYIIQVSQSKQRNVHATSLAAISSVDVTKEGCNSLVTLLKTCTFAFLLIQGLCDLPLDMNLFQFFKQGSRTWPSLV